MNKKFSSGNLRFLFKRGLSAIVDILVFAIILKICKPFLANEIEGRFYTDTWLVILLFYIILVTQDLLLKRTLGKLLFNLHFEFLENKKGENNKKNLRLVFRRTFDTFEIICPFIYIISILVTGKNQKLGDKMTNIIVLEKIKNFN